MNYKPIYFKLRDPFLMANPLCKAKLDGCTFRASELHHMIGRQGVRICIMEYFFPICNSCHMIITRDSKLAYEKGFSIKAGREDVMKRVRWVKENLTEYLKSLGL